MCLDLKRLGIMCVEICFLLGDLVGGIIFLCLKCFDLLYFLKFFVILNFIDKLYCVFVLNEFIENKVRKEKKSDFD